MPTDWPFLAPAWRLARWLLSALAVLVIAAAVVYIGALQVSGDGPGVWTAEDAQRTGISAVEVADPSGMLSRDRAIAHARAIFDPPDPDVRVDAFLMLVPIRARSGR